LPGQPRGGLEIADLRHQQPVGAGVEQPLDVASLAIGEAHVSLHAHRLRGEDHRVGGVERMRRVLHVDHHEIEPGMPEQLDRLEARYLDPGADQSRSLACHRRSLP
jgi:hypothetical protein